MDIHPYTKTQKVCFQGEGVASVREGVPGGHMTFDFIQNGQRKRRDQEVETFIKLF